MATSSTTLLRRRAGSSTSSTRRAWTTSQKPRSSRSSACPMSTLHRGVRHAPVYLTPCCCPVGCRFVLVGAAVTRLNRYVDRVTHDPTNLTATDYENEKHVLSLMRDWVKRHVKFMSVPCGARVLVAGCVDAAPSDCTQVHAARAYHTQLPRQGQVPGVEKPGEAARVQPQLLQVRGRGCTGRCS